MSSVPRILQVTGVMDFGGAETMLMNLYRQVNREKVQFDFVVHTNRTGAFDDEILALGGRVFACPKFRGVNLLEYKRWWSSFLKKHTEYRVLHSHIRSTASLYLPIAKRHGLVTIAHSHSTSNGRGPKAVFKDMLQFPLRYQADYLFACSQEAGEWLYGKRATKQKNFRVIPNAIDSEQFRFDPQRRDRVRRELGIGDSFVIGHVGRLSKPKNHVFLFRIFQEVLRKRPDSILLLVGDGELRESLEAEAKKLGIADRTLFLGSRSNVSDYYQAMDAFVFPSLWEGLPTAVVEAQAAGLPCIVSDTVTHEVDLQAGLVKSISLDASVEKWASKVNNAKRNDTSGFVRSAGFDIKENAAKMETFYESI